MSWVSFTPIVKCQWVSCTYDSRLYIHLSLLDYRQSRYTLRNTYRCYRFVWMNTAAYTWKLRIRFTRGYCRNAKGRLLCKGDGKQRRDELKILIKREWSAVSSAFWESSIWEILAGECVLRRVSRQMERGRERGIKRSRREYQRNCDGAEARKSSDTFAEMSRRTRQFVCHYECIMGGGGGHRGTCAHLLSFIQRNFHFSIYRYVRSVLLSWSSSRTLTQDAKPSGITWLQHVVRVSR